jgi:ATP-dependent DNA helicase PIF1
MERPDKDNIRVNIGEEFLSPAQLEVVDAFEQGRNLFVTGGAGSGKSYLLNFLKRNYSSLGLEVTASTGIAAVNVGGSTIHSWSGIGLANLPVEQIIENLSSPKFARIRRRIKRARALAIDEISMISAEVFDLLSKVFCAIRENDRPMGGIQMLLFGDFLQLPPVNRGSSNFNFCFNSQTWADLDLTSFVLSGSFRQADEVFVKILNNLRINSLSSNDREILESRVGLVDNSAIRPTILTTHNLKVEQINNLELKKIPHEEVVRRAEYFGDPLKIEFLKKNCLASEALSMKVGSQVMMIKNTYQKEGIINGSLGIIRDFSARKNYPTVEFTNGKTITISPEEWLIERFDEDKRMVVVDAGVTQIPLILAWAMTIHKSQGLTLDKISCDLSDAFSPGQVYVALSRARSLEGVFIKSINFEKIFADQDAVKFYRDLEC